MYRALATADVHSSDTLPYARRDPQTGVSDRLLDTIDVLQQICVFGCDNNIRDIWILGDLLDKRFVDAVTLDKLVAQLMHMRRRHKLYMIPGNHEAHDVKVGWAPAGTFYTLDAFARLGFWVAAGGQATRVRVDDGPTFLAIPYGPTAKVEALLQEALNSTELPIPVLHQSIQGGRVGSWACPEGLKLEVLNQFPAVLSGHFHTPQDVSGSVRYLGAPLQHNFGDAGEVRGFWDLSFGEHGETSARLIPVVAPRFRELEWPQSRLCDEEYIRITVRGSGPQLQKAVESAREYKQALEDAAPRRFVHVQPVVERVQAAERLATGAGTGKMSWAELTARYVERCDVTGFSKQRLIELGNKLLDEAESRR